ncbi:MAG: 16S rRNA (uracil(1498)-N(3))-methyltransferase [Candidatus Paracaedibacteraceae bacterium]|nr:16S rRNA (uracil(1498)-N(3))-methyltransferase [Candidatus Paracaedibacteraceae bacterium]
MTRLYYPDSLVPGLTVSLADEHIHYLRNVLRYSIGDTLNLFNQGFGEFEATLAVLTKSKVDVLIGKNVRQPETEKQLTLVFCPIKNDALHYLIEKCTEIGVTEFQPVIMQHGNIHKVNIEKLQRIATDAAQQCERLSVPFIHPLKKLEQVLSSWDPHRKMYVCFERLPSESRPDFTSGTAILVGPEGGLHPDEVNILKRQPFVEHLSLGKNILRAETAAVAASTLILIEI